MEDVNVKDPKVSVVIVTHNRQKDCSEAIHSALNQKVQPHEIIVIDDASEPPFRFKHPQVKVMRNQIELGLAASRNIGIKTTEGDIIAFTDDDATVSSMWIKDMKDAFKGDVDVLGGPAIPLYLSPPPNWWDVNAFGMLVGVHNAVPVGCNFAVRKTIFEKVGYFDERLGRKYGKLLSGEEEEFLTRILKAQGKIVFSDKIKVYHKVYPKRTTMSYLLRRSWYQGISDRMMYPVHIGRMLRSMALIIYCLLRICIDSRHARKHLLVILRNIGYLLPLSN